MAASPHRTWRHLPALRAACAVLLLLQGAVAVYDHGPVYPPSGGTDIREGYPTWYRDDFGNVCEPCVYYDPLGTGPCLSTYVSGSRPICFSATSAARHVARRYQRIKQCAVALCQSPVAVCPCLPSFT
jgi:hypothetical protein